MAIIRRIYKSIFVNLIEAVHLLEPHCALSHYSNWSQHSSSGLLTGWTSICGHDSTHCTPVPSSLHCQDSTVAEAEEQVATIQEGAVR